MFNRKNSCYHSYCVFMWIFHLLAVVAIGASLAYAYSDKFRSRARKIARNAEDCIDSCCDALDSVCE